ncbi:4Fe-4S cluster-binding domain-containing protein [Eisenbergiella sp.]
MKKYPFIKLFTTLNGTYFYDINKNDIVEISPDCYQHLSKLEESNSVLTIQDNSPDEIKDLLSQGYLSNHRFEIIEHPLTDELENILNRRMQKITLQVTQNCNLRCSYCHYTSNDGSQRIHSNKSMDILTAKKALLFLRDHSIDTQDIYIGFYGGEPLLEMRLIKELVTFAENIFFGKTNQLYDDNECNLA